MRRALLTAARQIALLAGVDFGAATGSGLNSAVRFYANSAGLGVAPTTGTITEIRIYRANSGSHSIRVMTGTYSGTTFTVRDTTAALGAGDGSGWQTYAVALPVVAGDSLALYLSTTSGGQFAQDGSSSGTDIRTSTNTTTPAAGGTYTTTLANSNKALLLSGWG